MNRENKLLPREKQLGMLRSAIKECLDCRFRGALPSAQSAASSFTFGLLMKYAQLLDGHKSRVVYMAPHSRKTVKDVQKCRKCTSSEFERRECVVDALVCQQKTETLAPALLACESEMWPNHDVKYSFESGDSDYIYDLWKLLHFRSPQLLFVARVPDGKKQELKKSLTKCATEYRDAWRGSRLSMVILPKTRKRGDWLNGVRVGVSDESSLSFQSLG